MLPNAVFCSVWTPSWMLKSADKAVLGPKDAPVSGLERQFGKWHLFHAPTSVPAVLVPLSVSGKTVPTVPVSGSGSVPKPPCIIKSGPNICCKYPDSGLVTRIAATPKSQIASECNRNTTKNDCDSENTL